MSRALPPHAFSRSTPIGYLLDVSAQGGLTYEIAMGHGNDFVRTAVELKPQATMDGTT